MLLHAFGFINRIKSRKECLDDEFEKLDIKINFSGNEFNEAKQLFEGYLLNEEFKEIIKDKRYGELETHPIGSTAFFNIHEEKRDMIFSYIDNISNKEIFLDA